MATWFDWPTDSPLVPWTSLILTDGSVWLAAEQDKRLVSYRLVPDKKGSYERGTFEPCATLDANSGLPVTAVVLADGRVMTWLIAPKTSAAAIYDPVANTWTMIPAPANWSNWNVALACVLPDGRVLCKPVEVDKLQLPTSLPSWIYDPATGAWTKSADAHRDSKTGDAESWALLPDGSVLSIHWSHERAERFVGGKWVPAAAPPTALFAYWPPTPGELRKAREGVLLLLPDGRVLASGREGSSAYFVPPATPGGLGSWAPAPSVPANAAGKTRTLARGLALLLPTGNVLCLADQEVNPASEPRSFLEFDGVNFSSVGDAPGPGILAATLLPTGQAFINILGRRPTLYTPSGSARADLVPFVDPVVGPIAPGTTIILSGRRFNGVSQATHVYDSICATNYPLCSFRNLATGDVTFARTFGHSSMAVATGGLSVSTQVAVPNLAPGKYSMCVSVSGASHCQDVEIAKPLVIDIDLEAPIYWITTISDDGMVQFTRAIRIVLPNGKVVLIPFPKTGGAGPRPPRPNDIVQGLAQRIATLPKELRAPLKPLLQALKSADKDPVSKPQRPKPQPSKLQSKSRPSKSQRPKSSKPQPSKPQPRKKPAKKK